ncbi:SIS domain-containing protein, partial [bacterium]|nr:SIS domain-containing protein [bacterium]
MSELKGMFTYKEILSQGQIWEKTIPTIMESLSVNSDWKKREYDEYLIIGCGSTHYLSLAAASMWSIITKKTAYAFPSSEFWLYPKMCITTKNPTLITISRSGQTTETLNAMDVFKEITTKKSITISCYENSEMVKRSEFSLVAKDAWEKSIAQTRSFSSMYIATQLLAGWFIGGNTFLGELKKLPSLFEALVAKYKSLAKLLGENKKIQQFVFLGSGPYFGLAEECMLKMKEMSLSVSQGFRLLEYRHGPMSVATENTLIIGMINSERQNEELSVLKNMKSLGATTLAIVDKAPQNLMGLDYIVEMNSGISDIARAILNLPILQLLAFYRAKMNG